MIDAPPPRSAARVRAAALLCLALALTSCGDGTSDDAGDPAGTPGEAGGGDPATSSTTGGAEEPGCPRPERELADFGAAQVLVRSTDGEALPRCVLVADRVELRRRGLMGVDDLGPYDGMVFAYPADSREEFWMRDTPMPLTIAWVDADGGVVSTADMEPCLDGGSACPTYPPAGPFRWAIEVPQGGLGDFGLVDGARMDPASMPPGGD